jgi:hypothetical protein
VNTWDSRIIDFVWNWNCTIDLNIGKCRKTSAVRKHLLLPPEDECMLLKKIRRFLKGIFCELTEKSLSQKVSYASSYCMREEMKVAERYVGESERKGNFENAL